MDRYHQLVEAAPDAILVVDRGGRIVMANLQAERTFGYPRDELLGADIELLVPDRLKPAHVGMRSAFAASPISRPMGSGLDLRARRKDGSELPVEISLTPIQTPEGSLTSATVRDITERRRMEEEARRISSYLRSAVESVADAFALFDEQDRLVLVNSAARNLFDRALDGPVAGRTFGSILDASLAAGLLDPGDQGAGQLRARWLSYHRDPAGALDLRATDGRTLRVTERRTAEGGSVMVVADITEDARRSDELRRAHAEAEAASAAKSEFLSSMSHELRTPLNAILGFAQLLQRDRKTPLTERQQERIAHVIRGGEHLLRLIDEILDLSRIEAGRVTISAEPVGVPEVIQEVRATLEPMAGRAGVALRVSPLPPELPLVRADRTRLAQILMNFGSNAVKYGHPGGHATFRVSLAQGAVRLSVKDDGIGIPDRYRGRIFEPFQRAGQETGPIEGSGIGLAISKRLAELMGGRVGFESEAGRGSEFWVEVPAHMAPPAEAASLVGDAESSPLAAPGPRRVIVYIEDNPSNIAFMRDLIDDLPSVELVTAPTAEIGLELVRSRGPALVIMDINLPGMSGIEATRRLASWPETGHIPVVALSAAVMPRDRARAEESGFYRYLTKPVKVDELTAVLEELLLRS